MAWKDGEIRLVLHPFWYLFNTLWSWRKSDIFLSRICNFPALCPGGWERMSNRESHPGEKVNLFECLFTRRVIKRLERNCYSEVTFWLFCFELSIVNLIGCAAMKFQRWDLLKLGCNPTGWSDCNVQLDVVFRPDWAETYSVWHSEKKDSISISDYWPVHTKNILHRMDIGWPSDRMGSYTILYSIRCRKDRD